MQMSHAWLKCDRGAFNGLSNVTHARNFPCNIAGCQLRAKQPSALQEEYEYQMAWALQWTSDGQRPGASRWQLSSEKPFDKFPANSQVVLQRCGQIEPGHQHVKAAKNPAVGGGSEVDQRSG